MTLILMTVTGADIDTFAEFARQQTADGEGDLSMAELVAQWQAAREVLNLAVEHMRVPPSERKSSADWCRICSEPADFYGDPWI